MAVKQVISHPKFSRSWVGTVGADIALLQLQAPLKLSSVIDVAPLPAASLRVKPRTLCWVTGWGVTEVGKDGPGVVAPRWVGGGRSFPGNASFARMGGGSILSVRVR